MPRVKQIRSVEDYPHTLADAGEREQLGRVFERYRRYIKNSAPGLYGDDADDEIVITNSWSQMVHNPRFAELMLDLSDFVLNEMSWSRREKVRELAILAIYQRQRCDYGYRAHLGAGAASGVTSEQIAELPLFRTSDVFDDEERTVIEFTHAALDGHVSDELFDRAKALYGEQQMVELTAVVAYWAFWGILINALQPDYAPLK
jgi:AhpD family alkylhydroperoxidase